MAKNLLGSGSKGRTGARAAVPNPVGQIGDDPGRPWVDPNRWQQQENVGLAAKRQSAALKKSKSSGIKP
jgi:hypothetical protein